MVKFKWKAAISAAGMIACGSAMAQEPFISGVYLASQALCQQAKSGSLDDVVKEGNLVLSAKGLRGTDYDCAFIQVAKAPNAKGWLVSSFCHESSGDFPDLLTISQSDDGSLSLVSVYGNGATEDDAGATENDGDGADAGEENSGGSAQPTQGSGASGTDSGENSTDTSTYYACQGVTAP